MSDGGFGIHVLDDLKPTIRKAVDSFPQRWHFSGQASWPLAEANRPSPHAVTPQTPQDAP